MFKKISTIGISIFMITAVFSTTGAIISLANNDAANSCAVCKDGLKKPRLDVV